MPTTTARRISYGPERNKLPGARLQPSLAYGEDGVAYAVRVDLVQPYNQHRNFDASGEGEILETVYLPLDVTDLAFLILGDEMCERHEVRSVHAPIYREP